MGADAAQGSGLDVVRLSPETIERLRRHLPAWWAPNNPVDMVAGLGYGGLVELVPVLMESAEVDGVIAQGLGWMYLMLDPAGSQTDLNSTGGPGVRKYVREDIKAADRLVEYTRKWHKPLLLVCNAAPLARRRRYPGLLRFLDQGIMVQPTMEDAVRAYAALAERHEFLKRHGARDAASSPPARTLDRTG